MALVELRRLVDYLSYHANFSTGENDTDESGTTATADVEIAQSTTTTSEPPCMDIHFTQNRKLDEICYQRCVVGSRKNATRHWALLGRTGMLRAHAILTTVITRGVMKVYDRAKAWYFGVL